MSEDDNFVLVAPSDMPVEDLPVVPAPVLSQIALSPTTQAQLSVAPPSSASTTSEHVQKDTAVPMYNPNLASVPVLPSLDYVQTPVAVAPSTPQQPKIFVPSATPIHWFFEHEAGGWVPFSLLDSTRLEELFMAYSKSEITRSPILRTDGGRYDVDVAARVRIPAYWTAKHNAVRRSSWYMGTGEDFAPIEEAFAARIEKAYVEGVMSHAWPQRLEFENGDACVLRNEAMFLYYTQKSLEMNQPVPRIIRRGYYEPLDQGENLEQIMDHLVLVVGGSVPISPPLSSLGFVDSGNRRGSLVDCVDNLRYMSRELMRVHFEVSAESQSTGRVEFLPVDWATPNPTTAGAEACSLPSVRNLRQFLHSSMMEASLYTSNGQAMVDALVAKINTVLKIFLARNPHFNGKVSFFGHGFGGCILYDVLSHQQEAIQGVMDGSSNPLLDTPPVSLSAIDIDFSGFNGNEVLAAINVPSSTQSTPLSSVGIAEFLCSIGLEDLTAKFVEEDVTPETLLACSDNDYKDLGVNLGKKKKIITALTQYQVKQEELSIAERRQKVEEALLSAANDVQRNIKDKARGVQSTLQAALAQIKEERLRAHRISYPVLTIKPQFLVLAGTPLGLLENLTGRSLITESTRLSCSVINLFHPYDPLSSRIDPLVNGGMHFDPEVVDHHKGRKRIHLELKGYLKEASKDLSKEVKAWAGSAWGSFNKLLKAKIGVAVADPDAIPLASSSTADASAPESVLQTDEQVRKKSTPHGQLNGGAPVDYVLQEDPFEAISEHLNAIQSHNSYWHSEDTVLFILNKVYLG